MYNDEHAGVGTHYRGDCKAGRKPTKTGRGSKRNRFPRRRVGTRNWTREQKESVPTPARGNQKLDAGAKGIGSHAGAWEPENLMDSKS